MAEIAPASKNEILKRLKRIEGQVKGIQRMIEENKSCVEILTQVAAVRAAVGRMGGLLFEMHSSACIEGAVSSEDKERAALELAKAVRSFIKFAG